MITNESHLPRLTAALGPFTIGVLQLTSLMALPLSPAEKRAGKPTKGGPARREETIKQSEAADAATPPPKGGVLLVGGSNARRWTNFSGTHFNAKGYQTLAGLLRGWF